MKEYQKKGFTLIELLVVMAVIGLLLSMMSVGYRSATIMAKNLRQKAEFKGMETGLYLFEKEFGDYPDSSLLNNGSGAICGAHRLAEALVGRDERGFEPQSKWYAPTDQTPPSDLYTSTQPSLIRRKGPYVQFKQSGIYTMGDLYGAGNIGSIYGGAFRTPIITDTFGRIQANNPAITKKIGMPILYFKADGTKRFRINNVRAEVNRGNLAAAEYHEWAYNFDDNLPIVNLMPILDNADGTKNHFKSADPLDKAWAFYEMATQTADSGRAFFKPYNNDTFILISAGWDGIYGTKDDITNFENK